MPSHNQNEARIVPGQSQFNPLPQSEHAYIISDPSGYPHTVPTRRRHHFRVGFRREINSKTHDSGHVSVPSLLVLALHEPSSARAYEVSRFIMFCLRSWLPLLFIPTNASPAFIFLFFLCTYFLNRPCFYCSFLLLILFLTSCNWSDRCFLDLSSNWFQPRPAASYIYLPISGWKAEAAADPTAGEDLNATASAVVAEMFNTTAGALATAATEQIARTRVEWTGLGLEWLRSLLGRREWRIDCLDLYIRL